MYIPAVWNDKANESWLLAVDDIRTEVVRVDIMKEVKVEIISWQTTSMRNVGAVEGDHPLVTAWPKIKPAMHAILAQHQKLHENWRTIDVVRLVCIPSYATHRCIRDGGLDPRTPGLASS